MCRDKVQATMDTIKIDTIKIRTSKDKEKDEDVSAVGRYSPLIASRAGRQANRPDPQRESVRESSRIKAPL